MNELIARRVRWCSRFRARLLGGVPLVAEPPAWRALLRDPIQASEARWSALVDAARGVEDPAERRFDRDPLAAMRAAASSWPAPGAPQRISGDGYRGGAAEPPAWRPLRQDPVPAGAMRWSALVDAPLVRPAPRAEAPAADSSDPSALPSGSHTPDGSMEPIAARKVQLAQLIGAGVAPPAPGTLRTASPAADLVPSRNAASRSTRLGPVGRDDRASADGSSTDAPIRTTDKGAGEPPAAAAPTRLVQGAAGLGRLLALVPRHDDSWHPESAHDNGAATAVVAARWVAGAAERHVPVAAARDVDAHALRPPAAAVHRTGPLPAALLPAPEPAPARAPHAALPPPVDIDELLDALIERVRIDYLRHYGSAS